MLPAAAPTGRVTPEEYLAFDRASEISHEYVNGEIRAMTGASREHGLVVTNITGLLYGLLRGRACEVFSHGIRVRIPVKGNFVYPDVVVACGGTELEDDQHDTMLNPVLIVEVLSPSTAAYDRGEKLDMYRRIPSLRDYLIVSQTEPLVHRFRRAGEEQQLWRFEAAEGLDASIELQSIGCVLQMADIYERVFPAEPTGASSTQEAS
ncbi:MAG TPA: Uma2 family endonuclease [Longimicrobium sp.]|jgi:Uma2 family endonuclease